MESGPIVIEKTFEASAATIWQALTNKDLMKQWYFNLEEFKPELGFEFRFAGGPDGKSYNHICVVVEVQKEESLAYTWRYEGYDGVSTVSFDLSPQGDQTKLTLTHKDIGSFPADNPDFARANFVEGWNQIINVSLTEFLEGKQESS
jgi:uncharacterized protein YndB with AHSA1/START domain